MIGKTKDGVFYYAYYYKDAFGVRRQRKVQNIEWKTKREAKQAMDLDQARSQGDVSRITVEMLFKLYLDNRSERLKKKSIYTQTNAYDKHIAPFFAKRVISEITNKDISIWQRALLNHGYKNRYLEKIQELFRTILNFGVKYDYIKSNPFKIDYLRNKDEIKQEMSIWTNAEFDTFIDYVDEPVYNALFKTLYWCGLRVGEAAALTVADVNFIKCTININKTYDFIHHVVTTPKTSNSYRTVTMPNVVLEAIQGLLQEYQSADGYNENALLFGCNHYLAPTTIKRKQRQAIALSKVPHIRIHDLRHSHVSLLINLGLSSLEISKRLGHSVQMVNNVYGHLFPEKEQLIVEKLNALQRESSQKILKN
jgi:integrase